MDYCRLYTDTEICLKCVDENEILYDRDETFLKILQSQKIDFPDILNTELLKNVKLCQETVLMYIKQRIILNEPQVRFHPKNDVIGMDAKINNIQISQGLKAWLRENSKTGYKCLKDLQVLYNLTEFDSERQAYTVVFGQKRKMQGYFDIVTSSDESVQPTVTEPTDTGKNTSQGKCLNEPKDTHESGEATGQLVLAQMDNKNCHKATKRAVISVVVTARNYISAVDIYRQLLFSYIHTFSNFFILAFHLGPLVEHQELVLYEYIPDKRFTNFIESFGNVSQNVKGGIPHSHNLLQDFVISLTVQQSNALHGRREGHAESVDKSHGLDVNQLEALFRKVTGRCLHKVADLREYFKYLVYDCPGVKDNEQDKKDRYDRYMEKQSRKKELRREKRLGAKQQHDVIASDIANHDTDSKHDLSHATLE